VVAETEARAMVEGMVSHRDRAAADRAEREMADWVADLEGTPRYRGGRRVREGMADA
jgi:hypothetical protein